MYVHLASTNMLLAVYPNYLTCYVSYLHFLKTGFAILQTVTIERALQNGDEILNFPLFNILDDLKMNMFVWNMRLINMTN